MTSAERHEARYQRRKAARERKLRETLDQFDNLDRAASPIALMCAHMDARCGVLWKYSPAKYDQHYMKNAVVSSERLQQGKNVCQGFYSFGIIERGKKREIHSVHYTERVIRRSVCVNCLVPILSHNLIYDNGASLEGKGITFAQSRVATFLHRYYREYGDNEGYVIVVDFRKYFANIRHDRLFAILDRYVLDERLNRLSRQFVQAGDREKPESEKGRGLFIGPEDSQILAVAFPNHIDHFIKDGLRCQYYERYNDDSIILVRRKEDARRILGILLQLYKEAGIIPNPKKTQIVKISRGFTYLKTTYYLEGNGRVVRTPCRSGIVRERRKLKSFRRFMDAGEMNIEQVCQSYMSWRGYAKKGKNAGLTIRSMDALFMSLFHEKPWKKISKLQGGQHHGSQNRNSGRDQRTQAAADQHGLSGHQAQRGRDQRCGLRRDQGQAPQLA